MPSRSPSIVLVTLCARLLKKEPMEDDVEVGVELEVVVFGRRLWPSVEVFNYESCQWFANVHENEKVLTVTIW
jgi:hypothetical protein